MADGPASARVDTRELVAKRTFPHMRPLTDAEAAAQHADAIWTDVRSTHYGRAKLRQHHARVGDRLAWRFPYADRVYVAHRDPGDIQAWAVSLWVAPWADSDSGLPDNPEQVGAVHGEPVVWGKATRELAVKQLARDLYATLCDHGCHRGRDSCSGCDVMDTRYDEYTR